MTNRLSILVLCGGFQSTEHQISVLSARNVIQELNTKKYHISVAYILIDGRWLYFQDAQTFMAVDVTKSVDFHAGEWMRIVPGDIYPFQLTKKAIAIDCVMPILHGTHGEDGAIQGLLSMLNVAYVGPDVLAAAIAMHKDVAKRLLRQAGLPVVDWLFFKKHQRKQIHYTMVQQALGDTVFIKPNSLGSSVGINKAIDENSFHHAIDDAFQFDDCILIEKAMMGAREIECSVLGNEKPVASLPGEIVNHTEFYSYSAKYLDDQAATVQTPVELSEELISSIRKLAVQAFETARCVGMARIDFFLTSDHKIYINEINTIPGFTNISMYPKNWEASGLSQEALFDELIQLGMMRFKEQHMLIRHYSENKSINESNVHSSQVPY